jgi:hypothetical protein
MEKTKLKFLIAAGSILLLILLVASASSAPEYTHVPRIKSGTSSSTNWGGYAVTASPKSVTDVKGSWTVPAIQGSCPSTNQYSSFWVGIDGYNDNTVEQIGTDSDCLNGSPTYYAWYEFYPHPSITISSFSVSPGDNMSAEVNYVNGQFIVTITDVTTHKSFSTSAKVNSAKRSSAEWIAEAPSSSGVLPLADFGIANFGLDYTGIGTTNYATVGGVPTKMGSFDSSSLQMITMATTSGVIKAKPSLPSFDGTSFNMTWKSP